jgi:hypothetical protein
MTEIRFLGGANTNLTTIPQDFDPITQERILKLNIVKVLLQYPERIPSLIDMDCNLLCEVRDDLHMSVKSIENVIATMRKGEMDSVQMELFPEFRVAE